MQQKVQVGMCTHWRLCEWTDWYECYQLTIVPKAGKQFINKISQLHGLEL